MAQVKGATRLINPLASLVAERRELEPVAALVVFGSIERGVLRLGMVLSIVMVIAMLRLFAG